MANKRNVALLNLLTPQQGGQGLYIVKVNTETPATFTFEGSNLALDDALFEVPEDFLPLKRNQRFFALPILNSFDSQRWGLIHRIDGPKTTKTFRTADMPSRTVTVVDGRITEIE